MKVKPKKVAVNNMSYCSF